ncbi:MAG: hypothetical protein A2622_08050 [Bdellovibrionales bacterium RIFCSPHIGHO2_01_FULL_40_29]|nr:MAG: hypothetical protein A2622_08050 [Bdellovibrionales bacterium RIFCSPHIGHO2_01_FULL_40_29]OFZ35448.1 MAG: hypothetical protein A3D17_07285 [Bdellovibrionales bacterium RIFCSPHIGHO2_02_FULL_40_15]
MIRINLLKSFSTGGEQTDDIQYVQSDERREIYLEFSKRFIAFIIGPLGLYFYESSSIPQLQAQIAQKQQVLEDLRLFNSKKKNLAEEIRRYEQDQVRLNDQMGFMRKISDEKANEHKLFSYLQEFTPESVWINKLELRGTELSISAEGDVSQDITKFLENLSNAQFLSAVSPTNQEIRPNVIASGVTTTLFNVKANFVTGSGAQ